MSLQPTQSLYICRPSPEFRSISVSTGMQSVVNSLEPLNKEPRTPPQSPKVLVCPGAPNRKPKDRN